MFDLAQITNWSLGFVANFQIENYQTGQKANNLWSAPLSAIPQAPSVWLMYGNTAAVLGLNAGGAYLYRPTFVVVEPNPRELPSFIGLSDFAVAEEHFVLVEG